MATTATDISNATPSDRSPAQRSTGITVDLCHDLQQVENCWRVVYSSYLQTGLISPNRFGLHTHQWAATPGTGVVRARMSSLVVATVAGFADSPDLGLPLDETYPVELELMRRRGRRLMEVGLLADRRDTLSRSLSTVMEIMRHVFYFGVHSGMDDLLIGVHPHHAPFYIRCLGFKRFSDRDTGCPHAGGAPLVPLRLDIPGEFYRPKLPRGLAMFKANPLPADMIATRAVMSDAALAGTSIGGFLETTVAAATPAAIAA